MKININYSNVYHYAKNCLYENHGTAENAEEFKKLIAYDHVFFEFKNDYRSKPNFLGTSVVALDCDNDHSENEADWITFKRLTEIFADVRFVAYTSRNHMKLKRGKCPRPRFHILFPIERITSADKYGALLKRIQQYLPVFDENAFDAGRFYFGNKEAIVRFHEGEMSIIDFLENLDRFDGEPVTEFAPPPDFGNDIIPEGKRNSTMSQIAAKLIKRYGKTSKAIEEYKKTAAKCSPPLDSKELESIWISAQKFYDKISASKDYIPPEEYEKQREEPVWDKPVPFSEPNLPTFPVHTLPDTVRGYVTALAESTQTPVDMCACSVLAALALCVQGKYKIQGKPDWIEPLNLYVVSIAEPSERKSAVISAVSKPITAYEAEENLRRAPLIEKSKMELRVLEKKQKVLEDKIVKQPDKVNDNELLEIADEIAQFRVMQPLKLYVDDITTEKLSSALNESGTTAILSSEGGIFDLLAGMYSKNVNIDVFLKAYSGDTIRVDRIGRPSESIKEPALTILLTVQPSVISGIMNNRTFRGRGLTARFLYCMPRSRVGARRFDTKPIPERDKLLYNDLIADLLDEDHKGFKLITLSRDAGDLLKEFSEELEPKIKGEYADISDWAGKLVGTVLRIAGILTLAEKIRCPVFDDSEPEYVVSADTMQNAITLGSYFIQHAKAAYDLMGADETTENAKYILNAVTKRRLESFTRRDVMRMCQKFKKAADVQPVLDMLTERGFLWEKEAKSTGFKKPKGSTYLVNPMLYDDEPP